MEPSSLPDGAALEAPPRDAQTLVYDEDLISRDAQIAIERMTSILGPLLAIVFFVGALSRPLSRSRIVADAVVGALPPTGGPPSHGSQLHHRFDAARRDRLSPATGFDAWSRETAGEPGGVGESGEPELAASTRVGDT